MKNVRVRICNHTNKPVVQEKFGKEWVCMHSDTEQEDVKLVNKIKKSSLTKSLTDES